MPYNPFEQSRQKRTPSDYAGQIIGDLEYALIELQVFRDAKQFEDELFRTVVAFAQNTPDAGDSLYDDICKRKALAAEVVFNPGTTWAMIACAFCCDAFRADQSGETNLAWTYVVDARHAADCVLSQVEDIDAERRARRADAREGAARRLANDPKQAAKAKAKSMWLDWQSGRVVYENQSHFARVVCEVFGFKDQGNVEGWCRAWRKERHGG